MSSSGVEKRGSAATVRACDSCRRRKRKCAWDADSERCRPCIQFKETCSSTHVRKPREKSQRRNRISEYEARIQRLETLLEEQSAAQPQVQDPPLQPADQSMPWTDWVANLRESIHSSYPLQAGPTLGDAAAASGYERTFEEDAAFLLSSDSSMLLPTVTAGPSVMPPIEDEIPPIPQFEDDRPLIQKPFIGPPMQITHEQPPLTRANCDGFMPHPELGTALLSEFLVDFNTAVPMYNPYQIANHIRRCYMGGSDGTAVSWAATYVVFGLAHRLRAMSVTARPEDNEQADYYLSRILQTVTDLLLAPPSLGQIQCLLGMAALLQMSSRSTSRVSFTATALQLAQRLAYNDDQVAVPDQDIAQQRRVFWIAFFQATDESILSSNPISHRREDISTNSPDEATENTAGSVTAAEGTWKVNIFSLRVRLALIQAEAVEKVLSVKAREMTANERLAAVDSVLQSLASFRTHELFQLNAEQLTQLLYRSDVAHVLSLEASYFATVFRVQSFLVLRMDRKINPFSSEALSRIAECKNFACYEDAKRFLGLLVVSPTGDIGVCWLVRLSILAALCTVLAHAVHNPWYDPSAVVSGQYGDILQMIAALAQKSHDPEFLKAADVCVGLFHKVNSSRRESEMQSMTNADLMPSQLAVGSGWPISSQ